MNQDKKKRIIATSIMLTVFVIFAGFLFFRFHPVEKEAANRQITLEEVDKSVYMNPEKTVDERIEALLSQMSVEEKVAQMMQPEQASITEAQVKKYGIGTVLSGGGSAPASGNTAEDWQARINGLKKAALDTRLSIPLLYGIDAVHGNNNVYGATVFPHNIALGAANDEELMAEIAEVVAKEVRAIGVQWTFAPTLGNPQMEYWGRTYECFSEKASDVTKISQPFIVGLQGETGSSEYLDSSHVLATAKHYIGEGYTILGMNQGNVNMSEEEFDELLHNEILEPYKAAIDAGVMTVMVSYNSVNGLKCHENSHLINDVLKGELNFQGFVISDYDGVQQIKADTYKEQIKLAVNSGIDVLMETSRWEECMENLIELVNEGEVTTERLDDAVTRILRVKFMAGLFEEEVGSDYENQLLSEFGCDEHREVARRAVSETLVLLKNEEKDGVTAMNALAGAKSILVVGKKADDIGAQCGGWTISWQGMEGDITEGTTILEGIREVVGDEVTVDFSEDGTVTKSYDAIVVVVGEVPYAEVYGDKTKDNLIIMKSEQRLVSTVRENAAAAGCDATVTTILFSGRPIGLGTIEEESDAIVMAWNPGTEGAGVADVLFGDKEFTGTLKYTWTKNIADISRKFEKSTSILYEYGYGLRKDGTRIE